MSPLAIVQATESPMNATRSGPAGTTGAGGGVGGWVVAGAVAAGVGGEVGGGVATSAGRSTGLGMPAVAVNGTVPGVAGRAAAWVAPVPAQATRVRSKRARMATTATPTLARPSQGSVFLSNTERQNKRDGWQNVALTFPSAGTGSVQAVNPAKLG